jgi:hypothetical protein
MRRLLAPLFVIAVLCGASSCSADRKTYSSPEFSGRVIDRDTGAPIAGAIVAARWGGGAQSFATGRFVCLHAAETTTDVDGRYRMEAWKSQVPQVLVDGFHIEVNAYKAGYAPRTETHANIALPKATGTADQQVKLPGDFAGRAECLEIEDGRKLAAALHRRLLADVEQAEVSAAVKAPEIRYFQLQIWSLEDGVGSPPEYPAPRQVERATRAKDAVAGQPVR